MVNLNPGLQNQKEDRRQYSRLAKIDLQSLKYTSILIVMNSCILYQHTWPSPKLIPEPCDAQNTENAAAHSRFVSMKTPLYRKRATVKSLLTAEVSEAH